MKLDFLKTKRNEMIAAALFAVAWGFTIYQLGKAQARKGAPKINELIAK